MTIDTAIQKALDEMKANKIFMPHHTNTVRRNLAMLYAIGYDEGNRSRSNMKPVIQMDKYGNVVEKFDSASSAARSIRSDKSNISKCCNGERNSIKGYHFKYA